VVAPEGAGGGNNYHIKLMKRGRETSRALHFDLVRDILSLDTLTRRFKRQYLPFQIPASR